MKKISLLLLLVVIVLSLSGCMILSALKTVAKPLEEGSVLPDDRIAVIGKFSTDPGLRQNLTLPGKKKMNGISSIMFTSIFEENPEDSTEQEIRAAANVERDQYFLISLPREKSYLSVILTDLPKDRTMYLYPNLEFDPSQEERFIYIGDITVQFDRENDLGGKDTMVEVIDNFDQIREQYNGFILDSTGTPLAVGKNLLGVTSKIIEMEIIRSITVTVYN